MREFRKIVSGLLAACLLVSMLPRYAWATEPEPTEPPESVASTAPAPTAPPETEPSESLEPEEPEPEPVEPAETEPIGSGTPDGMPPVLKNITISATTVTAPGKITLTMEATDDVSGISHAQAFFNCKDTGKNLLCSGITPDAAGKMVENLKVDQYVESGLFVLDSVTIWDKAGNSAYYNRGALPDHLSSLCFTVINLGADIVTSTSKNSFQDEVTEAENDAYIIADYTGNATLSEDIFTAIAGTDKTIDLIAAAIRSPGWM